LGKQFRKRSLELWPTTQESGLTGLTLRHGPAPKSRAIQEKANTGEHEAWERCCRGALRCWTFISCRLWPTAVGIITIHSSTPLNAGSCGKAFPCVGAWKRQSESQIRRRLAPWRTSLASRPSAPSGVPSPIRLAPGRCSIQSYILMCEIVPIDGVLSRPRKGDGIGASYGRPRGRERGTKAPPY